MGGFWAKKRPRCEGMGSDPGLVGCGALRVRCASLRVVVFSVHTSLFLTFSSPQDRPARQILAFGTPYFTIFGTEGVKVANYVHDCSMNAP